MRAIIVIPAEYQAQANSAASQLDPSPGGALTFTVPLFTAGQPQVTPAAYWCASVLSDAAWAQVQAMQPQFPGCTVEAWDIAANPQRPAALLAELALETATRD